MYEPTPVPDSVSPEVKAWLEDQMAQIAYWINELLKYNEDNP